MAELARGDDNSEVDVLRIGLWSIVLIIAFAAVAIGTAMAADRLGLVDLGQDVIVVRSQDATVSSPEVASDPAPIVAAPTGAAGSVSIPDDASAFGKPGPLVPGSDAHRLVEAHLAGDHAAVVDIGRGMDWSTLPLDHVATVAVMIRQAELGDDRCVEAPATEQLGGCSG